TLLQYQHKPLWELGRWLRKVLTGYYNYFAIPGNHTNLQMMRTGVGLKPCDVEAKKEVISIGLRCSDGSINLAHILACATRTQSKLSPLTLRRSRMR
ncbi:MAG: hypothetical protein ACI8R9_002308, partial [Paraglaciecola sp.]